MRQTLAAAVATLLLSANSAPAADSASLAVKAGFLLGHAQRCGVAAERVDGVTKVVQDLIAATAEDAQEQEAAGYRFAAIFLATAAADGGGDPALTPPCQPVIAQFERLERHRARTP
jgi:hypothetical protein